MGAVGSAKDGSKSLGMVLTTGDCDASASGRQLQSETEGNESAEPSQKSCLAQANDVILAPYYGRNPARGEWSFAQSALEMPDSWTSSSYAMTFEVQSHLLSGFADTCNGPGTCQAIQTQAECEAATAENANGIVEACSWGRQGEGNTEDGPNGAHCAGASGCEQISDE